MGKNNIDAKLKFDELELVKHLKNNSFISTITDVHNIVEEPLNSGIPVIFSNYTLHNIDHSYRVIKYMGDIVTDISKLNDLEITILILVGLLHDIGMAVSKKDIELIKSDNYPYFDLKYSAFKKYSDGNEDLALQEYIRKYHSQMSGIYIKDILANKFQISGNSTLSYLESLTLICQSHTESEDWIKQNLKKYTVIGEFEFNSQFIAHLLRLGDILDIDEQRTPLSLYRIISPIGKSDEEWRKHFTIQNYEKIVKNPKSQLKQIVFHGNCDNAHIHRKLLTYFEWVKDELLYAIASTNNMHEQYRLDFENTIGQYITTSGYTFSDYKMKLDFEAISSLLMGEKIYGSKELGLRELIQNSLDACRFRNELEFKGKKFGEVEYKPKIKIIVDKGKNSVSIKDNGVGMSIEVIKNHFLNIGKSYYNSPEFLLRDIDYKPIGNFGIGFLACFMLSDNIKIVTRYFKNQKKYTIELEKGNEFTSMLVDNDVTFDGTEVVFNYKDFLEVFDNKVENIEKFISRFFITNGVEIELIDVENKKKSNIKNIIQFDAKEDKGLVVDLSKYLIDVEGYALIKYRDNFIHKIDDINFNGDLFFYDDHNGITEGDNLNEIEIDDYKEDNLIKYYDIPIVEKDNELIFLNGLQYTDNDIEDVIERMKDKLKWISILPSKDLDYIGYDEQYESGDSIFNNFNFDDLIKFGHCSTCKIIMYDKQVNIFEGDKNKLYLQFETEDYMPFVYFQRYFRRGKQEMYVRDVLIKDYSFHINTIVSIIDVVDIIVNFKSKKIIPDVSRNKLDNRIEEKLNYSIIKAIHLDMTKSDKLNEEERKTLQSFIDKYFSKKTEFEK